jgi:NAD(P)H-flavin reductase
VKGEPADAQPEALSLDKRREGWRLACQCRISEDLSIEIFDPARDGLPARVLSCDWLSSSVLRLRVEPERPLRYQAGQHMVLWNGSVARPYSLASLPGEDGFLEFHLDCSRPGAFCDAARRLRAGDAIRLGELRGGALRYDRDWQDRPLLLLAAGTGLGPLWGVLREALRQEHQGAIHLLHLGSVPAEHYLRAELETLAACHPQLQLKWITPEQLPVALDGLRRLSRQALALVCGGPGSVETFAKRLYLSGLPRNQLLADVFVGSAR